METNHRRKQLHIIRPKTRADCAHVPRPCPFVSCPHNLRVSIASDGRVHDLTGDTLPSSCALDVVDQHPDGLSLAEIGARMGISRQRADQIAREALRKLAARFGRDLDDAAMDYWLADNSDEKSGERR